MFFRYDLSRLGDGFLIFLWVAILTGPLLASPSYDQILLKERDLGALRDCLKKENPPSPFNAQNIQWRLACPFEEFRKISRKEDFQNASLRYLMAHFFYGELERKRRLQNLSKNSPALEQSQNLLFPKKLQKTKVPSFWDFLFEGIFKSKIRKPASAISIDNRELELLADSKLYLLEMEYWLKPLVDSSASPLKQESLLLLFKAYGQALHFNKLKALIQKHYSSLFSEKHLRFELNQLVFSWISKHGAYPLKAWFGTELEKRRPKEITGQYDNELFYWIASLKLIPRPYSDQKKSEILSVLRKLWIAHADTDSQIQIRKTADELHLSASFVPPAASTLSHEELLIRSKALVKSIDADEALVVMNRVFKLPRSKRSDIDLLWKSLRHHVRLLRILDQRSEITSYIDRYLKLNDFFKKPARGTAQKTALKRMLDLGTYYWTYGSLDKAEKTFERVHSYEKEINTGIVGDVLYKKSRIFEQNGKKTLALKTMDQALSKVLSRSRKEELVWRRFFLAYEMAFEKVKGRDKKLQTAFSLLKKKLSRSQVREQKFLFWRGRINSLIDQDKKARKYFKDAYAKNKYSYYGILSGLALREDGIKVEQWKLEKSEGYAQPDWDAFMDRNQYVNNSRYKDLVRAYSLARIGQFKEVQKIYPKLDKSIWRVLGRRKIAQKTRRKFAHAMAWFRDALADPMGGLKASEASRIYFPDQMGGLEHRYLYPLAHWELIDRHADMRDIDPWVVVSLIRQESAFNPMAKSHANALGLMQMIPPVAKKEARLLQMDGFRPEDTFQPYVAVKLGVHHLARLFRQFDGSFICSFASYNAGSGPVKKWLDYYSTDFPLVFVERISYSETRNYVKKIIRNFVLYNRIYKDADVKVASLFKMPGGIGLSRLLSYENSRRISSE